MYCPACRAEITDDQPYCRACGAKVKMVVAAVKRQEILSELETKGGNFMQAMTEYMDAHAKHSKSHRWMGLGRSTIYQLIFWIVFIGLAVLMFQIFRVYHQ